MRPANTIETVLSKLAIDENGCWLFTGSPKNNGYAHIQLNLKAVLVHRAVYEHFIGPIPEGLVIDHLCRIRHCANPEHLEPVTCRENILRGELGRRRTAETCTHGHLLDDTNTYTTASGKRVCRICQRDAMRKHRAGRAAQ